MSLMNERHGFPKPYADLSTEAGKEAFLETMGEDPIRWLLFEARLGPLRTTDQILGDLTVVLRDAWVAVHNRMVELGIAEFAGPDIDETHEEDTNA